MQMPGDKKIALRLSVMKECATREDLKKELEKIKNRLRGAGVKITASYCEILQPPEDV